MRLLPTQEQLHLRDALRTGLSRACPTTVLRRIWGAPETLRPLWATLAELGVLGILAPPEMGGLGGSEIDLALAFEELGYVAAPGPLIEAAAIVVPSLLGLHTVDREVVVAALEYVVAGSRLVTAGTHPTHPVPWAGEADFCLLRSARGPRLLPRGAYIATAQPSVDATRRLALVQAPYWDGDTPAPSQRAALASAAMLLGLGRRMIDMTVAYANTRQQFGKPIGSFQAVKHQLVDAHAALELARPLVWRAGWSLHKGQDASAVHVAMAKAAAGDAAELAGRAALQVHGAIGYTTECDLHFFLKRTWALARSHGDTATHRETVAAHLLDGASTPTFD